MHRIGQTKPVKVYRLITRGTYEAEMFQRASEKLKLDAAVLQSAQRGDAPASSSTSSSSSSSASSSDANLIGKSSAAAFAPSAPAGKSARADDGLTNKEIAKMMQSSARDIFAADEESDARARAFVSEDIDQILARSRVVRVDDVEAGGGKDALSAFSKVRPTIAHTDFFLCLSMISVCAGSFFARRCHRYH